MSLIGYPAQCDVELLVARTPTNWRTVNVVRRDIQQRDYKGFLLWQNDRL